MNLKKSDNNNYLIKNKKYKKLIQKNKNKL